MTQLTHVESLVINETLDDAENLEQIYRSVACEAAPISCAESPSRSAATSKRPMPVTLAALADAIRSLVERQLLVVRHDPAEPPADDLSYVWRCWFEAASEAREIHRQSTVSLPTA